MERRVRLALGILIILYITLSVSLHRFQFKQKYSNFEICVKPKQEKIGQQRTSYVCCRERERTFPFFVLGEIADSLSPHDSLFLFFSHF